jgi:hypothetical protein
MHLRLLHVLLLALAFAKYVPTPAEVISCKAHLAAQCGAFEKKGPGCVACVKETLHKALSSDSASNFYCPEKSLEHFCFTRRTDPLISDAETTMCETKIKASCGDLVLKGEDCVQCIQTHLAEINNGLSRECTNFQLNHFCFLMNDEKGGTAKDAGIEMPVPVIHLKGGNTVDYTPVHDIGGATIKFNDPGAWCTDADCKLEEECKLYKWASEQQNDLETPGKHEITYTCLAETPGKHEVAAEPVVRTVITNGALHRRHEQNKDPFAVHAESEVKHHITKLQMTARVDELKG